MMKGLIFMLLEERYNLYKKLRGIFISGKLRVYLYIAAVLWLAVITQIIVNKAFRDQFKITDAFIKSQTDEMQSRLEIIAEYEADGLDLVLAKDIISRMADSIGLRIDGDIRVWEEPDRIEYSFHKQAKQAFTELKLISLTDNYDESKMKHYIIARLNLKQSIKSIDLYKKLLEASLNKLGAKSKQITLEYEGVREGELSSEAKRELARMLIDELHGELALEYDEGDLYTAYAYTGMLDEYIVSDGVKINIQLVIAYNEAGNRTRISLATPVMNEY